MMSPVNYENTAASDREATWTNPPRFGGTTDTGSAPPAAWSRLSRGDGVA